ncbi:hypothetical protein PVAND_003453 [Polypedilum vanderplanki]|uniref:Integrase catalytic domain-containing protein n=1 Tax=Polypedilum vanderplanki TaxID=319348 RepID=A0A9J6BVU7_POLVA|nr:hypothetical protein PVAND_003453 [Polypedilum vanderplanki]
MQIFIKQSMMFGPTSSPFISQFVKNWIANQFKSKFPDTAQSIISEVYMDDWFTNAPSIEIAIKRAKEGIEIFAAAKMQLIGIQSNSPELLSALPQAHIKRELIPLMTDIQTNYVSKVLGINWNTSTDKLVFILNESLIHDKFLHTSTKPTKREQCSLIARIFDVLGLLAHCIIRGRIILQHAWRNNIDWDNEVTDKDAKLWSEWLTDLKKAASIQIPRRRSTLNCLADAKCIELHTFSDAGKEAIAAVSYMVVIHNDKRESSFVMAKSKVAPLKLKSKQEITEMPRLELLAALVGVRLATHIITLHPHLTLKRFFWCDSNVVLHWIWNTNIKLPRFAVSPISEILELSETNQWKYIDTKLNVADLATKFQTFDFSDSSSVWFTGPTFLKQEPIHWPTQTFTDVKKEEVIICTHQLVDLSRTSHDSCKENPFELLPKRLPPFECALLSLIDKATGEKSHSAIMELLKVRKPAIYYSWSKLVRATARMLLMRNEIIIPLLRAKKWRNRTKRKQILSDVQPKSPVPSEYIQLAELFLIRFMQRQVWAEEINALLKGQRINNKKLLELSVFLDNDQVLRINSRVALPYNEYPQKYAPLVPRIPGKNSLSEIMLVFYHNMHRHVCLESQIAEFRSKYWMIALRERLNSARHNCNCCKLWLATQRYPYMADLPTYRVDRKLKPFEVTGLDCCGPFSVVFEEEERKVWILMFTCTVTRFIHTEILLNIDTKSTLTAILSTYAAHGPMLRLISDHGTNFIGASNLINREQARVIDKLKEIQYDVNQHFISQLKEFRWTFLPVKAAWFGGFYERLIGELKRGLREEIKAKGIDLQAFKIAMYETVHRLNNRPLTHIPISHEEEEVLTPHMLAKNRPGWPYLPSAHTLKAAGKPIEDRSYYIEGQKLADRITRRFFNHYLTELTRRTKWNRKQPPLNVGDLVLIIEPNETRQKWVRGEIVSFRPSGDSIPRVAEVRTKKGIKEYTIQHLAKIDIQQA